MKKNKAHVIECIILFMILLFLISISICQRKYSSKAAEIQYETYTVSRGETLWSISKKYVQGDPRELIYNIKQVNGICADIRPGQELKIPVGR